MKKTPTSKIGFKYGSEETTETAEATPAANAENAAATTEQAQAAEIQLSPIHAELRSRIEATERDIFCPDFKKLPTENQEAYIDLYRFYTSLNAELTALKMY